MNLMTRDEMEERLAKGEDPLELSIEKWERIREAYLDHEIDESLVNAETCALCYITSNLDCDDCIFPLTHGDPCDVTQEDGSEYWWRARVDVVKREDNGHVDKMIEALKKCRQ